MPDKFFNFTICVPTFNRQLHLRRLFNSLYLQTYKNFDVIVIDNNSTDKTEKVCKEFSTKFQIKYIKKKTSLTEAQNLALNNTDSSFFLRTDDDAEIKNNTLEIILNTFLSDNKIGGVSVITETSEKKRRTYFKFYNFIIKLKPKFLSKLIIFSIFGRNFFKINKFNEAGIKSFGSNTFLVRRSKKKIIFVDDLETTSLCFRTEVIKSIGGFDQRYIGIGDFNESDICLRVTKKSYFLVINTSSSIVHHVSHSGMFNNRNYCYDRIYNFSLFYFLHFNKSVESKIRFFIQIFLYFNFYLINSLIKKPFDIINFFPAVLDARKESKKNKYY